MISVAQHEDWKQEESAGLVLYNGGHEIHLTAPPKLKINTIDLVTYLPCFFTSDYFLYSNV